MTCREIRVRPVVRYIVTDFSSDDDSRNQSSVGFGIFDNALQANMVAEALANHIKGPPSPILETARQLRIDWKRRPGEAKEAIHWELSEVEGAGNWPLRSLLPFDKTRDEIERDIHPEHG